MIVLTVIIEERKKHIATSGTLTGLEPVTIRENKMAGGLLQAIEKHCVSRGVEGSFFIRREPPSLGEEEDGSGV
jgi:hypothetical protein